MDLATLLGLVIAVVGILGGMILEGGNILQILQPTAGMIVIGGTVGAVMISFPMAVCMDAAKAIIQVFFPKKIDYESTLKEILRYAAKARKEGILSLEQDAVKASNRFLGAALTLAVDGTDSKTIRELFELKIEHEEERHEQIPKVMEAAGGYCPTIGIIGAVLGLIQVMQHLDNIEEVGHGIATAFVATIYGVGFANIFFLPAGNKIKLVQKREIVLKLMMIEGVLSIQEGMNPRLIEDKLRSFMDGKHEAPKK